MRKIIIVITFVILLFCCCKWQGKQQKPTIPKKYNIENCLVKWHFESNSQLDKIDDIYYYFQHNKIVAKTITENYKPVALTKDFSIVNEPLLFANKNKPEVVVSDKFFTTLRVVSVPSLTKKKVVGRFLLNDSSVFRQLVKFLFTANIIQTYLHINSEICLMKEKFTKEYYQAHFTGKHTYYTNSENEVFYQFSIQVFIPSGKIVVHKL
ncbi:hypothetical protein [Candidatus Uabimicrobium sp. HlEnr_7]|uniref:hypothetical protein n=1 Tax=Candidatus Uabimicrobium helgolandensis TaxID=3095367 RepID=UPI0035569A04